MVWTAGTDAIMLTGWPPERVAAGTKGGAAAGCAAADHAVKGTVMTEHIHSTDDLDEDVRDWDLQERDRLLADGTLTDPDLPDPAIPTVEADQ